MLRLPSYWLGIGLMGLVPTTVFGFSSLVIFGDSLSDVGNVSDQTIGLAPGSSYYQGRYSNGPLWVEALASQQGLPAVTHSRDDGSDWAYAGTKTGSGTTTYIFFSFPNVGTQISNYLNGRTPTADQLFVVWAGGNDFIGGQTNVSIPVNNIANHVTALANAGAKNIIVPNLPPLGQVPRYKGTANESTMDSRSLQFNSQLATTLTNLEMSLNLNLWQFDVGALFQQMLTDPSAYGFSNVTNPALNGSTVVPNPDQYLFWDDIHPTRVGHALVGTLASDLLDTHRWAATASSASWGDTTSWKPGGAPQSRWIVNAINDDSALSRIAEVTANSSVRRLTVGGPAGKMIVRVNAGAQLSTAESLTLAPGGALHLYGGTAAAASFAGDATSELSIQLSAGMLTPLSITGAATLDGALSLSLSPGFVALPGSSFTAMSFASRTGELDIVNATGYAGLSFEPSYGATSLTLLATALPGDANLDGQIDITDLAALATSWQTSGNWLAGDFDGSGFVDITDLAALATNWQQGAMPSLASVMASVPEPSSALLVMLVMSAASRPHRRN